jgi:NADH-ubiquinone oxidoreductase chain 5
LFSGLGTSVFNDSICSSINNASLINSEFINSFYKNIPLFFTILGLLLSVLFIHNLFVDKNFLLGLKVQSLNIALYTFLSKKWHFDQVFNELVAFKLMSFGYKVNFQLIDKGNIEVLGPKGISSFFSKYSTRIHNFHTGLIYNYLFLMVCFLLFFFFVTFSFLHFPFFLKNAIPFVLLLFSYVYIK